jgi:dethiobiotin synthetase
MTAFFVTGSGTDIGKTWVSAALLRHWRAAGLEPEAIKPVATGYDPQRPEDSDGAALLAALGRTVDGPGVEAITPFRFRAPLSPDQAARREGGWLSAKAVADVCGRMVAAARGPVLVEGAGGVMSPLNDRETMLDLAVALRLPMLFVAGSYLGAISHALTGLHALAGAGMRGPLVLVNETPHSTVDLDETAATIASHAPECAVIALPRGADAAAFSQVSRLLGVSV